MELVRHAWEKIDVSKDTKDMLVQSALAGITSTTASAKASDRLMSITNYSVPIKPGNSADWIFRYCHDYCFGSAGAFNSLQEADCIPEENRVLFVSANWLQFPANYFDNVFIPPQLARSHTRHLVSHLGCKLQFW